MRPIALLSLLLALAACGADGEPEAPTRTGLSANGLSVTGLSVSGTVSIGITGGS